MTRYKVGIIGCGNIGGPYAEDLKTYAEIELVGVADIDPQRAKDFAKKYHVTAYADPDTLIADQNIEIVVNLTSHFAHRTISEKALNAKKHVYSEKPLATTAEEAQMLVELAQAQGVRLACSPFTLIGEAQQTAWKWIREGKLGKVRVAFAEVNWGRIESWHPAPGPFYEVGALFDVGVYPLTILTAMFGAVHRVSAYGKVLHPDRVTKEGAHFHISTPDFTVVMLETESGTVLRLTSDFYVSNRTTRQTGIEFHGDEGSLFLESWQTLDGRVQYAKFGEAFEDIPLVRLGKKLTWGQGVHELVRALIEGRPHRFSGEHAAHITDVLTASARSMAEHRPVEVASRFSPPLPMEWSA